MFGWETNPASRQAESSDHDARLWKSAQRDMEEMACKIRRGDQGGEIVGDAIDTRTIGSRSDIPGCVRWRRVLGCTALWLLLHPLRLSSLVVSRSCVRHWGRHD